MSGQRRPPTAVAFAAVVATFVSYCGVREIRNAWREPCRAGETCDAVKLPEREYPAQNLRFSPDPRCCFEEPRHGWIDPRGVWVVEPARETCFVDGGWVRR